MMTPSRALFCGVLLLAGCDDTGTSPQPDLRRPDLRVSDSSQADRGAPTADKGADDKGAPDKAPGDKGAPDKGAPDKAAPDKAAPDKGAPDKAAPDKAAPDKQTVDKTVTPELTPSCTDNIKNGTETDVDCGGSCPSKCAAGKGCATAADCVSGVCDTAAKTCLAPSCADVVKNGTETDVDCGGSCPSKCAAGKGCATATDCVSGVCDPATKLCAAPSCSDGLKNGTESDVDCGGPCAGCANGKSCNASTDCASGACNPSTKTCVAPSCSDGVKNQNETDVDCGGSCPQCEIGKSCKIGFDCVTYYCNPASGKCDTTSCSNNVIDAGETDVDCGGVSCIGCGVAKTCLVNADCADGRSCSAGKCTPRSCLDQRNNAPLSMNAVYTIDPDGAGGAAAFDAYCEMVGDGGGWTLVMKVNGNNSTFPYSSSYWTNTTTYNASLPALDGNEAKLASFSSMSFTAIRVGMRDAANNLRWIVVNDSEPSFLSAVNGSFKTIASGATPRASWSSLIVSPTPSLQPYCNSVVFNRGAWPLDVRFGFIANQENDCATPDSFIGFGGGQLVCWPAGANLPAGNVASCGGSPSNTIRTPTFGYILIR
jgi:hypothetical protein